MYRKLFPGDSTLKIEWFAYVEESGRCRTEEFVDTMPEEEHAKLCALMVAWARHGKWDVRVKYVHAMDVPAGWPNVYVIKTAGGARLYFIRCRNDAVAVTGFYKKSRWSKKDDNAFMSAESVFKAAAAECKKG